jgi:RNA polymerase sigma factor (sigma-70 family)
MSAPSANDAPAAAAPDHTRWFAEEIQPHESSLRSFLRGTFPAVQDVDDVVQESYLRTLRAKTAQPIRCAKAFLFTVARRLALDIARHERASPIAAVADFEALRVIDDRVDVAGEVARRERIALFADAIASLPDRCRDVFILHKINGYSRRETAHHLDIAEKTVEAHAAHAMQRCGEYLRRRGITSFSSHEAR